MVLISTFYPTLFKGQIQTLQNSKICAWGIELLLVISCSENDFPAKCCSTEPAPLLHWPLLGPHAPAQPQHLPEDDNVKFNIGNTML